MSMFVSLQAGKSGAESTCHMKARAGRASYVSTYLYQNQPDPGAAGVAIWLEAALKVYFESHWDYLLWYHHSSQYDDSGRQVEDEVVKANGQVQVLDW